MIPLSALNQFMFCPRRAALIHVEGIFEDNHHTLRGDIVHEHADLAGYEVVKGVTLLRALPVFSERLGLSGKCDIVEVHPPEPTPNPSKEGKRNPDAPLSGVPLPGGVRGGLLPVEFKLGKRRQWENDDVQLCAQALCLEEMFGVTIPHGAIFHAQSKRRREVEFNADLRRTTESAVIELHALLNPQPSTLNPQLPAARYIEGRCEECSLFEICLPRLTQAEAVSATAAAVRRLYQT